MKNADACTNCVICEGLSSGPISKVELKQFECPNCRGFQKEYRFYRFQRSVSSSCSLYGGMQILTDAVVRNTKVLNNDKAV